MYSLYSHPLRPSKSYRVVGWWGALEILGTAQSPNFPFPLSLDLTLRELGFGFGLRLDNVMLDSHLAHVNVRAPGGEDGGQRHAQARPHTHYGRQEGGQQS